MRSTPSYFLVVCLLCASIPACTTISKTERLRTMPIPTSVDPPDPSWMKQTILIRRFEDRRPEQFAKSYPSSHIPGVSFIHAGGELEYPEHAGLLSGKEGKAEVRRVGGLDIELPYLLAQALPGGNALAEDQLRHGDDPVEFDYVVEGRVLQSTSSEHASFVLGMLSIVGVPMVFARQQMRLEVAVYEAQSRDLPVLEKVYSFDERMASGLYYNHQASQKLAKQGLEQTLTQASQDIVNAVLRHQARCHSCDDQGA
jgi:hypothetical protein